MVKANPQIHMELQEAPNSQNNIDKEKQSWWLHTSQFQNLVQSYMNQNSVVVS